MFAVLCVLLAAGGHALAMGEAPPVWVQVAAVVPLFAIGCLLGGRERSLAGIGGATLAAQGGLHLAFDAARPRTVMAMPGMSMNHAHARTPHATAAHVGAALVLTWWLRRGEAALWSLLRWAVTFLPGLAAWWQAGRETQSGANAPRPTGRPAGVTRQVQLRYAVHRRGPPTGMSYAN
ncbi:hypothetical protein ACIBO9_40035 [Streptomyces prunicolor]|uniref:hypothetical protein n=1 Tax=Streptomyces prunicolor TaxID=67348 RepID=UPI0037D10467